MAKKQEFTYESAKKRLEQILQEIDSGKTGIDELEKTLQEARDLIEKSLEKLENAEKIIIQWEK
jgi:exodeoxyribonuclease VII small subunit